MKLIGTLAALGVCVPPTVPGAFSYPSAASFYMKHDTQNIEVLQGEPVGIVISRGREPEMAPRFVAYMWAPGPDDESAVGQQAA